LHIRKLVKAGIASHTVSLPKNWLSKNKLNKGSIIYIVEEGDNTLRIKTNLEQKSKEKKEKRIQTEKKNLDEIQREITSAYLNNYSKIIISGKDLNKKASQIRQMLHDFVALEIVEQTSQHIIAKDMLNLSEVSINKTIRRMDMILRSMLIDSMSQDQDTSHTLSHRDCDINRLYFLLFRLLKHSLVDDLVAAALDLKRTQILGKWYLILNLQNLANAGKKINTLANQLNKKDFLTFKESVKQINQNYLDVMKSYFTNNKNQANKVAQARRETEENLNLATGVNPSQVQVKLVETLKTMSTLITNIARIIIDEE